MASDFAMSQPAFAPDRHEIWYSDGTAGFYALRVDSSVWPRSTVPRVRRGCPLATGRLSGRSLGPVTLGMTRARAARAFYRSSTHGRRYMDYFCLTPIGVRVGYPSGEVLNALSRGERTRVRGRVVLALTANPYYALRGVRPGARLASVARRLGVGGGLHIGLNTWYLAPNGASRLTVSRRAAWRLLNSPL
jgi:hypothetical protein